MKSFFISILIVNTFFLNQLSKKCIFSIDIWDYNYSMAGTIHYKLNSDSLIVTTISGLDGENNKVLIKRKMNRSEKKLIQEFLSTFPLESLSSEYKNELIQDGDQKRVEIFFNDKRKIIDIENYYHNDMANLFRTINNIVGSNFSIKYSK